MMNAASVRSVLVALLAAAAFLTVALGQAGAPPKTPAARFAAFDVFVDPAGKPLAAYQVDLKAVGVVGGGGQVAIVGIEGGETATYSQAPYYDPKAMQHERVILAAFSTAPVKELPSGRTRVARVHVRITGEIDPVWDCRLIAAGAPDGTRIQPASTEAKRTPPPPTPGDDK